MRSELSVAHNHSQTGAILCSWVTYWFAFWRKLEKEVWFQTESGEDVKLRTAQTQKPRWSWEPWSCEVAELHTTPLCDTPPFNSTLHADVYIKRSISVKVNTFKYSMLISVCWGLKTPYTLQGFCEKTGFLSIADRVIAAIFLFYSPNEMLILCWSLQNNDMVS